MIKRLTRIWLAVLATAVSFLAIAKVASAQGSNYKFRVLHTFKGGLIDGANSVGGLIRDDDGNVYGVATAGGPSGNVCPNGCGVVFRMDPRGNETILHFFTGGQDGGIPSGPLARDESGNLYGTTSYGGDPTCLCGNVYKLDVQGNLTILHTFLQGQSNTTLGPAAGVVRDSDGNLYGTVYQDGSTPDGAGAGGLIFKIDRSGAYSVLHVFGGWDGLIGGTPGTVGSPGTGGTNLVLPPLVLDPQGNIYGATSATAGFGVLVGGVYRMGTLFELEASGRFKVLYSFALNPSFPYPGNGANQDGCYPFGAPLITDAGTVFGTTSYCGGSDNGNIFRLEKTGAYSIAHTFPSSPNSFGADFGNGPEAGLVADAQGNFYGTTVGNGAYGYGSVFVTDGSGKYRDIYSFKGEGDGALPYAPVIRAPNGNLYGTAFGGAWEQGVVFELAPDTDADDSDATTATTVTNSGSGYLLSSLNSSNGGTGSSTHGSTTGHPITGRGALTPERPTGHVVVPDSSIERPGDRGKRAHTNVRMFVPDTPIKPAEGGGISGTSYFETPASLACVYKLAKQVPRCNPTLAQTPATGGSRAIAIVDAFDNSSAASDLALFSGAFGLPPADLQVVYAAGAQPPPADGGWTAESDLDIQMAHAMAPNAKIFLVEAASDLNTDMFAAVKVAGKLVADAGGGEVSMSWGGSEWLDETQLDSTFTTPGVVYFASSGDGPGTQYPSVSPNVVAVGGTTLRRDAVSGDLLSEDAWIEGGGGRSAYETRPSYQGGIASLVAGQRGVPDIAAVADPNTGVIIFWVGGPIVVGGTSAAAPLVAGIVNNLGGFAKSSTAELEKIYRRNGASPDFLDVSHGFCGFYAGDEAHTGWDFCTGVGSPSASRDK